MESFVCNRMSNRMLLKVYFSFGRWVVGRRVKSQNMLLKVGSPIHESFVALIYFWTPRTCLLSRFVFFILGTWHSIHLGKRMAVTAIHNNDKAKIVNLYEDIEVAISWNKMLDDFQTSFEIWILPSILS